MKSNVQCDQQVVDVALCSSNSQQRKNPKTEFRVDLRFLGVTDQRNALILQS